MKTIVRLFLTTCVFIGLCAPPLHAQLTTTTLEGTVTDPTCDVILGANVTAVNADTHFTSHVVSRNAGDYRLDLLPVGTYS